MFSYHGHDPKRKVHFLRQLSQKNDDMEFFLITTYVTAWEVLCANIQ